MLTPKPSKFSISGQSTLKILGKSGFFPRFQEVVSRHVGDFGPKSFPHALISKELKIICKVSGEIYTPVGYRGGGGGPLPWTVDSEQWSVVNHPSDEDQSLGTPVSKGPLLWSLFML
jgi:hypothetical protein